MRHSKEALSFSPGPVLYAILVAVTAVAASKMKKICSVPKKNELFLGE